MEAGGFGIESGMHAARFSEDKTGILQGTKTYVTDEEAVNGFDKLSQWEEGILPALESSHAVAWMIKNATEFTKDDLIILNVSGRGDKDVMQLAEWKAKKQ